MRCGVFAHLGAVLVKGTVTNIVQVILDRPMPAIELEQAGRISLGRRQRGHTEDRLALHAVIFEPYAYAFDASDLLHVGEVEGGGEVARYPDGAGLQAAVAFIGGC